MPWVPCQLPSFSSRQGRLHGSGLPSRAACSRRSSGARRRETRRSGCAIYASAYTAELHHNMSVIHLQP